jgi:Ala-tRNA(Pro) deacylase
MTIASSVDSYLSKSGVRYDVLAHTHTSNSSQSAQAAHIPGDRLAKSVLLQDDEGYLMAIIPATHKVDLEALEEEFGRSFELMHEDEIAKLFRDCEPGALPPLAEAYGVEAVLDESLADADDIYFEAGDHVALIHVSGQDFLKLIGDAPRARISWRH